VEVGAVWSQPDNPAGLGGKPVDPKAKKGDPAESAYAGHYFLTIPPVAPGKSKPVEPAKTEALAAVVH
jgi:hypothetical protein